MMDSRFGWAVRGGARARRRAVAGAKIAARRDPAPAPGSGPARPQSPHAPAHMHPTTRPAPGFGRELRTTAVLAGPLVAGHVATGMIGLVDGLIAGRHGTATLAAVSVGTALFWLPILIPLGTLMALPPTVSQLDGAGRRGEIGAVFRQALWLAALLGALMFALLTLAVHALGPMGIAEEIRPGAAEFLRGIRWGVPAL